MKKMKKSALAAAVLLSVATMTSAYAEDKTMDLKDINADVVVAEGDTLTLTDTTGIGVLNYGVLLNSGASLEIQKDISRLCISNNDGYGILIPANSENVNINIRPTEQLTINATGRAAINAENNTSVKGAIVNLSAKEINLTSDTAEGLSLHAQDSVFNINQNVSITDKTKYVVNLEGSRRPVIVYGHDTTEGKYTALNVDGNEINFIANADNGEGAVVAGPSILNVGQNYSYGTIVFSGQKRGLRLEGTDTANNLNCSANIDGRYITIESLGSSDGIYLCSWKLADEIPGANLMIGQQGTAEKIIINGYANGITVQQSSAQGQLVKIKGKIVSIVGNIGRGIATSEGDNNVYVEGETVEIGGFNYGIKVGGGKDEVEVIATEANIYGGEFAAKSEFGEIRFVGTNGKNSLFYMTGADKTTLQQVDIADSLVLNGNGGTMTFNSGDITGQGTTVIKGNVDIITGDIENTVQVDKDAVLTLNYDNGVKDTKSIIEIDKIADQEHAGTVKVNFDIDLATLSNSDAFTITTVNGNPTFKLGRVNVLTNAEVKSGYQLLNITNNMSSTFNTGTVKALTSDYEYTFGYGENGVVNINRVAKVIALEDVINKDENVGYSSYTLTSDYTATKELGALAGTNRDFSINGNGNKLTTATDKTGVSLVAGQTLCLNDIGELSGWANYAVNAAEGANVEIKAVADDPGTTDKVESTVLSSKLTGAGDYKLVSGNLEVADVANLAMTGNFENNGQVTVGGEGTLNAKVTGTGKTIINGKVEAPKGINTVLELNAGANLDMSGDYKDIYIDGNSGTGVLLKKDTDNVRPMNLKISLTDKESSIAVMASGKNTAISLEGGECPVDLSLSAKNIKIEGGTTQTDGNNYWPAAINFLGVEGSGKSYQLSINQDAHYDDGIVELKSASLGLCAFFDAEVRVDGKEIILDGYKGTDSFGMTLGYGSKAYFGQKNVNGNITFKSLLVGAWVWKNSELYVDGDNIKFEQDIPAVFSGKTRMGLHVSSESKVHIGENNTNGDITFKGEWGIRVGDGNDTNPELYIGKGNSQHLVIVRGVQGIGTASDGAKVTLFAKDLNIAAKEWGLVSEKLSEQYFTVETAEIAGGTHGFDIRADSSVCFSGFQSKDSIINIYAVKNIDSSNEKDIDFTILQGVRNNSKLTLDGNGGTMTFSSGAISGAGTTKLAGNVHLNVSSIAGTLDGNGATLQQTGDDAVTTLSAGKLKGTLNMTADVDMSSGTRGMDNITIGGVDGTPILNLSAINIVEEYDSGDKTGTLTFATGTGVTYKVNGTTNGVIKVLTNNNAYTFTGAGDGTVGYEVAAETVTFKRFVEDTTVDALDLTADMSYSDTSATQGRAAKTLNLNGHNVTATGEKMTVTVGATQNFNIAGDGSIDTNFNLTGNLNTSGNVAMSGEVTGNGTLNNKGTLDIPWANLKSKVVNNGTLNATGGGELSGQDFGGTINLAGDYTVDCKNLSGVALTAVTVNVDSASTLTLNNAKKDTTVQIIDGTATGGWADAEAKQYTAEETPEGLDVGKKVKLFTIDKTDGFAIIIDKAGASFVEPGNTEDGIQTSIYNVATVMSDSENEKVQNFMDALSDIEDNQGTAAASNAIETVANMSAVAGVQSGTASMVNSVANNLASNLGSSARPNMIADRGGLRNTASDNGEVKIETVANGKANEVMPTRYAEKAYGKEVWASYIHSKQHVDGLKAGMLDSKSVNQYNGVTVGADLWSGKHSFGGVALSYADGNVNAGNLRNDTDYYGVSIYNRHDYKGLTMLTDVSYTHSKNDINISGTQEITADAKADAIGVGVRFETPVTMGKTTVTPYAGARYTYLKNNDYDNNLGMNYDTDNQNLVTIPVGLEISAEFAMPKSDWTFRPVLEGGYVWNLGDRDGNTKIGYMGAYDIVGFETSDPGQYFIRAAMQFAKADFTCEVGYRYSKGKSVRDNRWNVNLNYMF